VVREEEADAMTSKQRTNGGRARTGSALAALAILVAAFGVMPTACKETDDGTTSGGAGAKLCDPGENIFCRCQGGAAGTKTCKADGMSFESCVGRDGPCAPPSTTICEAGEQIFCLCANGDDGSKTCSPDGKGFGECAGSKGPCETAGTGGGGQGTGGGGQGTGGAGQGGGTPTGKGYLEPCVKGDDCASGVCPMGFCTKDCAQPEECKVDDKWVADCISFKGLQVCMPTCLEAVDCSIYGYPSDCGYVNSVDGVPDTVCADWLDALKLPPDGMTCGSDEDCNLGHTGMQRICLFQHCGEGCYSDTDCPDDQTCSGQGGNPGTCGNWV
jgi:hypothetical protein